MAELPCRAAAEVTVLFQGQPIIFKSSKSVILEPVSELNSKQACVRFEQR